MTKLSKQSKRARVVPNVEQMQVLFNTEFQSLKEEIADMLNEIRSINLTYENIAKSLTTIESDQRAYILHFAKNDAKLRTEFELRAGYGELRRDHK